MKSWLALLILAGAPAAAESLVAARTIPARAIVSASDLLRTPDRLPGAIHAPAEAVGLEARVTIYAGRPIHAGDLGPPALVERNEIVMLVYDDGPLSILTEGRALDRAALGERVRVMNLGSKNTVTGTVAAPGRISVP